MKTLFYLLLFCLLVPTRARAQVLVTRHSLGVGLERVGLDAPDGIGNRYLLGYGRHWRNDRLILTGKLGYLSAPNRSYLTGTYYVQGRRRERHTADLTLAFDFVRHTRHALRLGFGPSAWYRREEAFDGGSYTLSSDGTATNVRVKWRPYEELNWGTHIVIEYEYALTKRLLARINIQLARLRDAGPSTIYGGGLGYRFY